MPNRNKLFADERLFRLIVQASPAGLLLVDKEGRIVLASAQALQFFGYTEDELLGETIEKLVPAAHRSDHVAQRENYSSHPKPRTMAAGRDLCALRKDGSEFPVDISLHPLATEFGVFVLANVLDTTDRRRAEQELERRHAMERLAVLGQLAGGVAHEIRTSLCVIRNDAYYLKTMADRLGDEGIQCIDEITQAVGKANRIVGELLDLTRDSPSNPASVSIDDILTEALTDYPIPPGVLFHGPDRTQITKLRVNVDREQIARILTNLFRNAVQAMHGTGQLWVEVEACEGNAILKVVDSGPGIPANHRESVFEPLFTTKPNGVGLGLAVSQRYARRNRGELELSSDESSGTCFRLILPREVEEGNRD